MLFIYLFQMYVTYRSLRYAFLYIQTYTQTEMYTSHGIHYNKKKQYKEGTMY